MNALPLAGMRAEMLAYVSREPGTTSTTVARRFAIDHSTAAYHLRRLMKAGLIVAQSDGRSLRYYVVGCGICPFLRMALPTLRDERFAELLAALEGRELRLPAFARDAQEVARTRGRLTRLAQLGLVANEGGVWYPTRDTEACREAARGTGACDQWGRCPVSQRWRAAAADAS